MNAGALGCLVLGLSSGCTYTPARIGGAGEDRCDPLARFDPPQLLSGMDRAFTPADASLTPDELTLFLTQTSPSGDRDLYMASRDDPSESFDAPVALVSLNSTDNDAAASISADGLTVVFHSRRIVSEGQHLYVATRPSMLEPFGVPALVGGAASPTAGSDDMQAFLTSSGQELWFVSNRGGDLDIYRASKSSTGVSDPVEVTALGSPSSEQHVMLSEDRLTVYFASNRDGFGSRGSFDVYRSHRASVKDGFPPPTIVEELSSSKSDNPRWLSPDNCRMYLHSDIGGSGFNIYVATRRPSS